ncbi:MFS transporter [Paraburkholderia dipogonis]|uniref:MFS transporter n=1 Tax=Paraburkholderia dipogonis TaxID=1211383 RepID=A0ABW9B269_9BURK
MRNPTHAAVPEHGSHEGSLAYRSIGAIRLDSARSWYALATLTLSYSLAYIDRQLLNLLVDPIRHSLAISDTQLSLVQGIAFVSAYLLAAPIFGRLVDVTNRRNILVVGICLWSIFTALCGRADTYLGLLVARFGVGASEACVFPVGCSLIADLFSARRAPRALSIFMLGPLLGGGFSLLAGGLVIAFASNMRAQFPILATLATWQLAFVMIGLPGLLVGAVLFLTVREPARSHTLRSAVDDRHYTVREAASFIWKRRGFYGRIYIGLGMLGIVVLGMPAWLPAYLIRVHGVAPAMVGFRFGLLVVTFGAAGVLIGPWVARVVEKRGYEDAALRVAGYSMIGILIFCVAIPFAPGSAGALAASAGAVFFFSLPTGIMAAATQLASPSRMRGAVGALYTISGQLIGFGLGPISIALVTDKVFHDPKALGYSIAIVCTIASLAAAWLMFTALPHYRRRLDEERLANAA